MLIALALLTAVQSPSVTAVPWQPARGGAARDSTPFARTLEESGEWAGDPGNFAYGSVGGNTRGGSVNGLGGWGPAGGGGSPPGTGPGGLFPLPRVYEVTIQPGFGHAERFLFQEAVSASPRPLLIAFHKYGVSHYDALLHTSFFEEARRRGWYCIAPLSYSQSHFSSIPAQQNTEAAIDWVRAGFLIDPARIYAVGFSMGAGAALNYAARHLDPNAAMIAAVFAESGIVSHEDTYPQVAPGIQTIYDAWFGNGAPGSATPFDMQRSSLFSFDPQTLVVGTNTDLARNLLGMATYLTRTTGDIPYLITQNDLLAAHLVAIGGSPSQHPFTVYNYPGHSWDAVPEKPVCDWLRTKVLAVPASGRTLADRDARYYHFLIEQDAAGAFTPFEWSVQTAGNTVAIEHTRNLLRVTVYAAAASLSTAQVLTVITGTDDGIADEIQIDWAAVPPNDVLRDGVATSLWSYNGQRVTLSEFDGGSHTWQILP